MKTRSWIRALPSPKSLRKARTDGTSPTTPTASNAGELNDNDSLEEDVVITRTVGSGEFDVIHNRGTDRSINLRISVIDLSDTRSSNASKVDSRDETGDFNEEELARKGEKILEKVLAADHGLNMRPAETEREGIADSDDEISLISSALLQELRNMEEASASKKKARKLSGDKNKSLPPPFPASTPRSTAAFETPRGTMARTPGSVPMLKYDFSLTPHSMTQSPRTPIMKLPKRSPRVAKVSTSKSEASDGVETAPKAESEPTPELHGIGESQQKEVEETPELEEFPFQWLALDDEDVEVAEIGHRNGSEKESVVDGFEVKPLVAPRICDSIWTACKTGNICYVQTVLKHEPGLIHEERDGRSPLYHACHCGHFPVVRLLLDHGARDTDGNCLKASLTANIRKMLRDASRKEKRRQKTMQVRSPRNFAQAAIHRVKSLKSPRHQNALYAGNSNFRSPAAVYNSMSCASALNMEQATSMLGVGEAIVESVRKNGDSVFEVGYGDIAELSPATDEETTVTTITLKHSNLGCDAMPPQPSQSFISHAPSKQLLVPFPVDPDQQQEIKILSIISADQTRHFADSKLFCRETLLARTSDGRYDNKGGNNSVERLDPVQIENMTLIETPPGTTSGGQTTFTGSHTNTEDETLTADERTWTTQTIGTATVDQNTATDSDVTVHVTRTQDQTVGDETAASESTKQTESSSQSADQTMTTYVITPTTTTLVSITTHTMLSQRTSGTVENDSCAVASSPETTWATSSSAAPTEPTQPRHHSSDSVTIETATEASAIVSSTGSGETVQNSRFYCCAPVNKCV